jgi:hypothetical protein
MLLNRLYILKFIHQELIPQNCHCGMFRNHLCPPISPFSWIFEVKWNCNWIFGKSQHIVHFGHQSVHIFTEVILRQGDIGIKCVQDLGIKWPLWKCAINMCNKNQRTRPEWTNAPTWMDGAVSYIVLMKPLHHGVLSWKNPTISSCYIHNINHKHLLGGALNPKTNNII